MTTPRSTNLREFPARTPTRPTPKHAVIMTFDDLRAWSEEYLAETDGTMEDRLLLSSWLAWLRINKTGRDDR
jgi:hypothetical protein